MCFVFPRRRAACRLLLPVAPFMFMIRRKRRDGEGPAAGTCPVEAHPGPGGCEVGLGLGTGRRAVPGAAGRSWSQGRRAGGRAATVLPDNPAGGRRRPPNAPAEPVWTEPGVLTPRCPPPPGSFPLILGQAPPCVPEGTSPFTPTRVTSARGRASTPMARAWGRADPTSPSRSLLGHRSRAGGCEVVPLGVGVTGRARVCHQPCCLLVWPGRPHPAPCAPAAAPLPPGSPHMCLAPSASPGPWPPRLHEDRSAGTGGKSGHRA